MKLTIQLTSLAALSLISTLAHTADNTWAIAAPQWSQSSDSDGLNINKLSATVFPNYTHAQQWQGVELQQQRYRQNGNALDGQSLSYVAQNTSPTTGMGYSYKAGWSRGPNQSLLSGELSWNQAHNDQLQWGVFANRDWVESFAALQNNVHYDLVGANVDYALHPRLTSVASITQTRFSDHQNRQQQRLRLVWDALPEHGITLQWAYKHQLGEKDVAQRLYFNPERLDESITFIGWRKRLQGWQIYARSGWGTQRLVDQPSTPTRVSEINLSSPVHGEQFFKLRLGASETLGLNGPGYVYRYADVQWIVRF